MLYKSKKYFNLESCQWLFVVFSALLASMLLGNDAMASTGAETNVTEMQKLSKGLFDVVKGEGLKIGLMVASAFCIIGGLVSNNLLKPAFAVAGTITAGGYIMDWINTSYTIIM